MKRRDGIENLFDILNYVVIVFTCLIMRFVLHISLNHKHNFILCISDNIIQINIKNVLLTYDNVSLSSPHAVALIFSFFASLICAILTTTCTTNTQR